MGRMPEVARTPPLGPDEPRSRAAVEQRPVGGAGRGDTLRDAQTAREQPRRRSGHRREYDGRQPRRSFEARIAGVVRDVGTFRAVALRDLVERQFDGHPFAAGKGIAHAARRGWIERRKARGPRGGEFTVLVATEAGAARAAELWRAAGRSEQRTFAGAVQPGQWAHDVGVYRAVGREQARIEAAGGQVTRIRIDAELRSLVAARSERARRAARADEERRQAAAALGLPVEGGKVLVPDAQVEYVDAAGRTGRCNVEVASEHYRGRAIRAKARAGFAMYAASGRAASAVRRALGGGGGGRRGGGLPRPEHEVIEL
ncbi:MAG: hypothetical protein OXF93_05200 [Acidobacteria bacterium]|nr:hypothetical protein [Acidobacteriota bacterium]